MFLCDICYKDVKSVVVPLFDDDKEYEWFAFPLICELCNNSSKTDLVLHTFIKTRIPYR